MRNILLFLILPTLTALTEQVIADNKKSAPFVGNTLKGSPCIGNSEGYGPFDYSKRMAIDPKHLQLVEGAHFQPDVEFLEEKPHRSSYSPWPDLDYTLRAWPNHPRALLSMIRFQQQINLKLTKHEAPVPAECYLQRAIHFNPEYSIPYALYGYYLHKVGKLDDADKQYKKAMELEPDNAKHAYSYSELLIDMKEYEKALEYAKIAYQNGKPPQTLKNKLVKLGIWK